MTPDAAGALRLRLNRLRLLRAQARRALPGAEAMRRIDEREMRERLGEVAKLATAVRIVFLRQQARRRCATPTGARIKRAPRRTARAAHNCRPARSCRREKRLPRAASRRPRFRCRSASQIRREGACVRLAATVPWTRGSSGGKKPTMGMSSRLASSVASPNDWTNVFSLRIIPALRTPPRESRRGLRASARAVRRARIPRSSAPRGRTRPTPSPSSA